MAARASRLPSNGNGVVDDFAWSGHIVGLKMRRRVRHFELIIDPVFDNAYRRLPRPRRDVPAAPVGLHQMCGHR